MTCPGLRVQPVVMPFDFSRQRRRIWLDWLIRCLGFLPAGHTQIFVLPADGGTPRQLTFDARDHDGRMSWTPDGRKLVYSANAEDGYEYNPIESDVYSLDIGSGE